MANRAQSSTSVSEDASPRARSGGAAVRSHSGQGRTVNNLVFLVLCMAIMIGSFIAFASYPNSPLVWIIGLGLYALALLVPVGILQTSTAKRAEGGRTLAMDVPPTTEVAGTPTTAESFPDRPRDIGARDAEVRSEHKDDTLGKATQ
ncbi:hypothetical protein RCG67_15610 [Kocuria sp. CPCC 205292]|uniref:Uncharacterized protein n=1 Tax=Kocuria rosea subsp. polaris TaxID=136273 RepID=A0A0W8IM72_KOCRO|nr:hypothetical protein [Kocuria polaris]KUG61060.1 hypothetical protein AVL61_07790 [Kocuria polaris]